VQSTVDKRHQKEMYVITTLKDGSINFHIYLNATKKFDWIGLVGSCSSAITGAGSDACY